MNLPNTLIIRLGNAGLMNTTEHSLAGDAAYKAWKFRRSAMAAYNELAKKQAELKEEAKDDEARFAELNEALLKDESEVWASPLAVPDFLALAAENKRTPVPGDNPAFIDFYRVFENDLEGVLWTE